MSLLKMLHDLVIAVDLLVPAFIDDALVEDAAGHAFQSSFDQGRRGRFHFRIDMVERGYDCPSPVAESS
jgi:hypothetical protein